MKVFLTLFDYKIERRKIKEIQLQVSCTIPKGGKNKNKKDVSVRILTKHRLFRACLHEGGGPQVREVTCGGLPHLTSKRDHIKMRDYMDRRVTPPKRLTSPTWGPPPPCKQALKRS